jgi:SAM-dependent methyltransferase
MIHFLKRVKIQFDNILKRRGIGRWRSETSKCRSRLARFCVGSGIDIGAGGDPIVPTAVIVDLPQPYTVVGKKSVQLGGDARDLLWFKDGVLDYVFSSHVLEDFKDTTVILAEWLRVLKPNGYLIVYCPDQIKYANYCKSKGRQTNPLHVYPDFSLDFVLSRLPANVPVERVHSNPSVDDYSWELVLKKR